MIEVGRGHVGIRGNAVVCDHCQGSEVVLPCNVSALKRRIAPFVKRHLSCPDVEAAESVQPPVLSPTWPYVLAFAIRMEAKLEKNRHKGNREGWLKDDPDDLSSRLKQELVELDDAVFHEDWAQDSEGRERIANEAADVANFAMMIADVCGGVKP